MLNYVLDNNLLTKDKTNDRTARAVNVRSHTEQDLAEAIANRNMGISKPEALAMLEAASEIQLEWLAAGDAINMRLVRIHPSIPGAFENGEYPKEAVIRASASKEAKEAAKKITLQQVEAVNPIKIDFVRDLKSGTTNELISRVGVVRVTGHNLRVIGDHPSVCAELIGVDDPAINYRIAEADFINNNPAELLFTAPWMEVDQRLHLRVTTQFASSGKLLKTPRSVTFNRELTVVE